MGFIYLIVQIDNSGEESHKIGFTKNQPELRVKQLSTGNANQIRLVNSYESKHYKNIEKKLHKKYSQYKTLAQNEWFNLPQKEVALFTKNCETFDELEKFMKTNNYFYK